MKLAISKTSPKYTHISIASAAIDCGKKVLCEKPLALDSYSLHKYITEIDIKNETCLVFQNRFNPAIRKFYEFQENELGEPQYIAMTLRWWRDVEYYKDWHGNQELSGGPLITQAIHSLDLVTHITRGAKIKKISASKLKTRAEITLPDVIVAIVEFENSVIASIEVCLATHKQNLESSIFVLGSNGSIKISGITLTQIIHPKVDVTTDDISNQDYYGNGHSALYRTHSNYLLKIPDKYSDFLARPISLTQTMVLIEAIERHLK